MRRLLAVLIVVVGPLADEAQQGLAPSPEPGSLFLYPERIPLESGKFAHAERGLLFVPTNRSDPNSKVLAVEIYRFPATEQADSATPPLFRLHGGPGFPGLQPALADEGYYEREIQPYLDVADLIVVGQRGIGYSKPNTICEPGNRLSQRCREYWETAGVDLQGLTVVEAAADVRDAASALGYERIQLTGGSFGSHWGMTVLRYYPELVARAVLTGMEGPDHTYDMPGWVLNSITRMAEAAEQDSELAPLIPEGGLVNAFKATLERLAEKAVTVTVKNLTSGEDERVVFSVFSTRQAAYGYSGRISSRRGMKSWPADILYLYYGDYEAAAERMVAARSGSGDGPNYRTASAFMLDCGSGITPQRLATLEADPAAQLLGPLGFYYQSNCRAWDSDLGDDFRTNFDTDVPTVIVHGNWDVNTPFENALELVPHFKRSQFVVVNGGSHGALREATELDAAFRDALMEFYRTGDMSGLPDQVDLPAIDWEVPDIKR